MGWTVLRPLMENRTATVFVCLHVLARLAGPIARDMNLTPQQIRLMTLIIRQRSY